MGEVFPAIRTAEEISPAQLAAAARDGQVPPGRRNDDGDSWVSFHGFAGDVYVRRELLGEFAARLAALHDDFSLTERGSLCGVGVMCALMGADPAEARENRAEYSRAEPPE